MKNMSLIKVTFAVIATALASSLVNAKDVMTKSIPAIATPAPTSTQFDQLDLDKNGLLSLAETQEVKLINDAFTTIDSNSDATISKDEFTKYITK
ncbi:EF-hand domain-containing protein [Candidatus Colwellia aromaticivorans]|uniref:EF-hand domain-containing protein n=1 Tax=Candidatus Colwellia aromaticivorans TaxID=2267621 RepID=UPI000DF1AEEF|nr:EF-hand domain-containing protein [Candidatus Colwellia aromaticivorans]